jgi:hypothetical protein
MLAHCTNKNVKSFSSNLVFKGQVHFAIVSFFDNIYEPVVFEQELLRVGIFVRNPISNCNVSIIVTEACFDHDTSRHTIVSLETSSSKSKSKFATKEIC